MYFLPQKSRRVGLRTTGRGEFFFQLPSSVHDYVKCNKEVTAIPDLTTNDIVENIIEQEACNSEIEDDDCPQSTEDCILRSEEALSSIETHKKYLS